MHVNKQQLELNMEQQTGSKQGKKYIKTVYSHPVSDDMSVMMQSTSCEMLNRMKHNLESRLLGETSITSAMQITPPLWQKEKRT